MLFRSASGAAQAYVYVPEPQVGAFLNLPGYVNSDVYGDAIWRGSVAFTVEKWYQIKLYIRLNSFGVNGSNPDGIIGLTINNVTMVFDKMVWTDNKDHNVNGIMMDTFFGGSDKSWAATRTMYAYFRNFVVNRGHC